MIRRLVRMVSGLGMLLVATVAAYFVFMTVTDYRPEAKIELQVEGNRQAILSKAQPFSIVSFNIGYCGLDKGRDFFMDGGSMSRSGSKEQTEQNLENITDYLQKTAASFILLQEVDVRSSRSYKVDQLDFLKKQLQDYSSVFAINYKVPWVPVPLTHPMGSVLSGLTTFSGCRTDTAVRYQYPGQEKWPRQLAELDRCFIESRLPVEGGKQLVLINSHLSAYDKGGLIRKQQLGFLKKYITDEYQKGNYVIVGGDWNHQLPGTDASLFKAQEAWPDWCQKLPEDFTPEGFKWAVDKKVPTVRSDREPYVKGVNFTVVIDGFLVSPNVGILKINAQQLEFENSDHNPVEGVFELN